MSESINLERTAQGSRGSAALACEALTKRFPGVVALDDVSLEVRRGEVHTVVGENGAGKSTLIKILTGIYRPDRGRLLIDGIETQLSDPHDAQRAGISLVPQDVLAVPHLSVGRNILLGSERGLTRRSGLTRSEHHAVAAALDRVGADFPPATRAGDMSVPQLRLAQVARAFMTEGDVLVLDEPTAVLSEHDAEHLLERVERARADGSAILYVTHRLSEVMRLADRITVLRDGRRVGQFRRGEVAREEIVDLLTKKTRRPSAHIGNGAVDVDRPKGPMLSARGITEGDHLVDVDLDVHGGEIVGVAGVQGSGHGRLVKAIAGLTSCDGTIELDGRQSPIGRAAASFGRGIVLVPADRRNAGIVQAMSIRDNIALSTRIRSSARLLGLRWPRRERRLAGDYIAKLTIRARGPETRLNELSGGNQQKVVLARALESDARVLLAEEPTQGIDVSSKADVRALLREFAATGRAVVVATSEFEELIGLADRVVVLCLGRVAATLSGESVTYRDILTHALP
jgi:ABC-type sugar transport system ATPase subunit